MKPIVIHEDHQNGHHEVTAALRVLVMPAAEGGYFAQGLEIDYVATGATEDEARSRFASGFVRTVCANIERGRALDGLFKSTTHPKYWQDYFAAANQAVFGCLIRQDVSDKFPAGASVPRMLEFATLERATA